jgi:hypothetical protein
VHKKLRRDARSTVNFDPELRALPFRASCVIQQDPPLNAEHDIAFDITRCVDAKGIEKRRCRMSFSICVSDQRHISSHAVAGHMAGYRTNNSRSEGKVTSFHK